MATIKNFSGKTKLKEEHPVQDPREAMAEKGKRETSSILIGSHTSEGPLEVPKIQTPRRIDKGQGVMGYIINIAKLKKTDLFEPGTKGKGEETLLGAGKCQCSDSPVVRKKTEGIRRNQKVITGVGTCHKVEIAIKVRYRSL